jgi:hypothetical protein
MTANDGLAYVNDNEIVLNEDLDDYEMLETMIHEAEHMAHPDESERNVTRNAKFTAQAVWALGYRRVVK